MIDHEAACMFAARADEIDYRRAIRYLDGVDVVAMREPGDDETYVPEVMILIKPEGAEKYTPIMLTAMQALLVGALITRIFKVDNE
jgi:hypothetical protein